VLSLVAWWVAELDYLGTPKLGFTFYGALVVAIASNVAVLALSRSQTVATSSQLLQAIATVLVSVIIGAGLRIVLPGIPE
jgi:hypothetical protein